MAEEDEYPLVMVRWLDAWFDFDLRDVNDIEDDYFVTTVGFLIDDEGLIYSLAQEILPNDDGFRAVTHIPKVLVGPEGIIKLAQVVLDSPPLPGPLFPG